jgi:uncharacterized membrane protein YqiK
MVLVLIFVIVLGILLVCVVFMSIIVLLFIFSPKRAVVAGPLASGGAAKSMEERGALRGGAAVLLRAQECGKHVLLSGRARRRSSWPWRKGNRSHRG